MGETNANIRGIFFDLGGTLFRYSGRMGGGGLAHVLGELGIEAQPKEIGHAWSAATKEAGEHFGAQSYFLHKDLFARTLANFLAGFGHDFDPNLAEVFHQQQLAALLDNMPIREECHTALQQLREQGLYLSIVSNIDDDYLDPLVAKHDLHDYLDHWTSSEEAQSCKPDSGIYHYCLEKAGLSVADVLFVGDSLHHDVAGAASVGMRSARIVEEGVTTPLTHGLKADAEPTYVIEQLTDLVGIVETVNG